MNLEFGKNLKRLRHQKDLTQDELAQKLSLSVQAISRYETGAAYPDIEMLPVIAGFFGVTVDKLLGISSEASERRMDEYATELRKITDRKERLALLILSDELSEQRKEYWQQQAQLHGIESITLNATKLEMGLAVGMSPRGIIGIMDRNMAEAIMKKMQD